MHNDLVPKLRSYATEQQLIKWFCNTSETLPVRTIEQMITEVNDAGIYYINEQGVYIKYISENRWNDGKHRAVVCGPGIRASGNNAPYSDEQLIKWFGTTKWRLAGLLCNELSDNRHTVTEFQDYIAQIDYNDVSPIDDVRYDKIKPLTGKITEVIQSDAIIPAYKPKKVKNVVPKPEKRKNYKGTPKEQLPPEVITYRKGLSAQQVYKRRINILDRLDFDKVKALFDAVIEAQDAYEYDLSEEGIIAKNINKTTKESFCRYGDANHITRTIRVKYLNDKVGVALDVQAYWMQENFNKDIEPDDLAAFITNYENGAEDYPLYAKIDECKQEWKNYTGINYDSKFIKHYINRKLNAEFKEYSKVPAGDGDIF